MLDPNNLDLENLPLTIRAVFIIGPDKKLKLSLNYPASVGRNMDEIVRCVDALQLSAKHSVVSSCMDASLSSLFLQTLGQSLSQHYQLEALYTEYELAQQHTNASTVCIFAYTAGLTVTDACCS